MTDSKVREFTFESDVLTLLLDQLRSPEDKHLRIWEKGAIFPLNVYVTDDFENDVKKALFCRQQWVKESREVEEEIGESIQWERYPNPYMALRTAQKKQKIVKQKLPNPMAGKIREGH